MKIAIIGSGIIGLTTAYYLAKSGYTDIVLIDKNSDVSMETSYQNGGQLSYSHSRPIANKEHFYNFYKYIFLKNCPISITLSNCLKYDNFVWFAKFLASTKQTNYHNNHLSMIDMADKSRELFTQMLDEIEQKDEIDYNNSGILHVYQTQKHLNDALMLAKIQKQISSSSDYKYLSKKDLDNNYQIFSSNKTVIGAIYYANDSSVNTYKLSLKLKDLLSKKYGTKFVFNSKIDNFVTDKTGKIEKIISLNHEEIIADTFILTCGYLTNNLLANIGEKIDLMPVKGYSITIKSDYYKLNTGIIDEQNRLVYSKLGNLIRIAGFADFGKIDNNTEDSRINLIMSKVEQTFPSLLKNKEIVSKWSGIRPMTPNSLPIIRKSYKANNLFINTGHGTLGLTLSCYSGHLLSNLI